MREREDTNRTREAGNRDEVEGVVTSTLNLFCDGAVGFIDWLDGWRNTCTTLPYEEIQGERPQKDFNDEE